MLKLISRILEGFVTMHKVVKWRWTFYLIGIMVMSLGITMTIKGQALGTSPWDVLHIGLFKTLGLTIGTWSILTGLVIISITSFILKSLPKIGTWINMVAIGSFIDLFYWLLPDTGVFAFQFSYFLVGLFVLGFGAGMYISPNLGAGPRDSMMILLVDKLGLSIKQSRAIIEVIVALAGWILGGPVGIGTIILALFTGYVVQFSLGYCRKLLMRCIGDMDGVKPFY